MTTKKKKLLFASIILIIVLVFVAKFLPSREGSISQTSPTPAPTPFLGKATGEKMTVSGVAINNLYNKEISTNPRGDTLFSQSKDYQILYFAQEKQFLISIIGSPFDQKRALAEQNFLKILGIDKEAACQLKTVVSTPSFANPDQSGINYSLSFCHKALE